MFSYNLDHLKELESESIFILREVAAQFEKPVLLFSGGKDSIVASYLAQKHFILRKFLLHFCILIQVIIFLKQLNFVMNG